MSEDEVTEEEMAISDDVDFADDGVDLGDDDIIEEEGVEMEFSTREIE